VFILFVQFTKEAFAADFDDFAAVCGPVSGAMSGGLLFSVEERMDAILEKLASIEAGRTGHGMHQSGSPAKTE